jgi:hypothetical protein
MRCNFGNLKNKRLEHKCSCHVGLIWQLRVLLHQAEAYIKRQPSSSALAGGGAGLAMGSFCVFSVVAEADTASVAGSVAVVAAEGMDCWAGAAGWASEACAASSVFPSTLASCPSAGFCGGCAVAGRVA